MSFCIYICECLLVVFVAQAGLCGNAPSAWLPRFFCLCCSDSITFHGFRGVAGVGVDWGKEWWWWGVYTKSHPESAS